MKHKASFFSMALMALAMAIPQNAKAYHFYSTAPSGQTLYYEVIGPGAVKVVSENTKDGVPEPLHDTHRLSPAARSISIVKPMEVK